MRYHLYPFFSELYIHFFAGKSNDLKVSSVGVLKVFYDERSTYGPDVLIGLINCMIELCKVILELIDIYSRLVILKFLG